MRILVIRYGRTKSVDDYNSETLVLEAELDEGEVPDQAILGLRDRVNSQLGISESVAELKNTQIFLEQQNAQLEANIAAATERWNRIQQFMEKLGVNLKNVVVVDDIPF